MKDLFFYPLAIAIIAGIVAFALSFTENVEPLTQVEILDQGFVVDGERLNQLTASPGTTVSIAPTTIIAKSHIARAVAPPSAGIYATLGPEFESAFGGRMIEVGIRARLNGSAKSGLLELGYFTSGVGDSAWQPFALTESFETYSFQFQPNKPTQSGGQDYVGFWPGPEGEQVAMEIERIFVKAIKNP